LSGIFQKPDFDFIDLALVTGDSQQHFDYSLFFCDDGISFTAQYQFCNLKGRSLVSIQEWVAVSYDMQSESRFAKMIRLCIYLIDQVIDRTLTKNSVQTAKIADYQLVDVQDFLGSENHDRQN
jgi:hypothetical protein